jgi:hypothetical protein
MSPILAWWMSLSDLTKIWKWKNVIKTITNKKTIPYVRRSWVSLSHKNL